MTRLIISLMVAASLIGCAGSKPAPTGDDASLPRLTDFEVVPGNHSLLIRWNVDRSSDIPFSGYNVYIQQHPVHPEQASAAQVAKVRPVNQVPYPGDTDGDPTQETFEATNLENGVRYYCHVRAVGTEGQFGLPSAEITTSCRTGGAILLEPMFKGDRDGYDFSAPGFVDADAAECDITLYVKDGEPRLIAASRIDPLLRETRFWDTGSETPFAELLEFTKMGPGDIEIAVKEGHTYGFQTQDGNYGKIVVRKIVAHSNSTTIEMEYVHQSIPKLMNLR